MKQKVKGWQLLGIEPRSQNLISALPLSFDNQTTTSPQQFSMCIAQYMLPEFCLGVNHKLFSIRICCLGASGCLVFIAEW